MTKHPQIPLLQAVADTSASFLDTLDPESFARELPHMIENLTIEFDTVNLKIDAKNISMISDVLMKGMQLRGFEFPQGETPFPTRLKTMAVSGYAAVEISLPRAQASDFAQDLRRGMDAIDSERAAAPS